MNRFLFLFALVAGVTVPPWDFLVPELGRPAPADPLADGLCIQRGSYYLRLRQIHGVCPPGVAVAPVPAGPPHLMEVQP